MYSGTTVFRVFTVNRFTSHSLYKETRRHAEKQLVTCGAWATWPDKDIAFLYQQEARVTTDWS
jgi:hypothetical protein